MENTSFGGHENPPILENNLECTTQEVLEKYEALLDKDTPEFVDAFYRGLGEMISSEIYEPEDYTKYWIRTEDEGEVDHDTAALVRKALKRAQGGILGAQDIQDYFWNDSLGSDQATAAMLLELDTIPYQYKDKKKLVVDRILSHHLGSISQMEESKRVWAGFAPALMNSIDFRADSYRGGKEPLDLTMEYLAKKCGTFDFTQYIPIWKNRIRYQIMPAKTIGLDIRRVLELEEATAGISQKLITEFSLNNLGRYPVELLFEQVEMDGKDSPYGVLLSSEVDWNNALHLNSSAMLELFRGVKEAGRTLRVSEFNGNVELFKKVRDLHQRYGAAHLIEFGVLEAHGNPNLVRTGGENRKANNNRNSLSTDRLSARELKAFQEMRPYFSPDATIILDSCSTGDPDGIGKYISQNMNIRVLAPTGNAAANHIRVKTDEGLQFSVDFKDSQHGPVASNVFENGRLV